MIYFFNFWQGSMAGNAENCFLNRRISFLCEIKVVEVNSGSGYDGSESRKEENGLQENCSQVCNLQLFTDYVPAIYTQRPSLLQSGTS